MGNNVVFKFAVATAILFSLLCVTQAKAVMYDGFDNGILTDGKWNTTGTLFSEHDGMLYFNGTGTIPVSGQQLRSTITLGAPFTIGMSFFDYASTNSSPAGVGQSAVVKLGLGPNFNNVSVSRGSNSTGGFFEFAWQYPVDWGNPSGPLTKSSFVVGNVTMTSGSIGLFYDGTRVYAAYNSQTNPGDLGWIPFLNGGQEAFFTPGWTAPVSFFIGGSSGGSGTTSFQVDNIGYDAAPVPVPPAIWLLGSGLIGLAGLRRRWKK